MHLLLEQQSQHGYWHRAVASSEYVGTASEAGVFKSDGIQQVLGKLNQDSVVVLFLHHHKRSNDAKAIDTIINKCKALDGNLKVWCHYGGDIDYQELPDRWSGYDHLPSEGTAHPKKTLDEHLNVQEVKYPHPFSSNFELKWEISINGARSHMRVASWNDAYSLLNEAWEIAEKDIARFRTMRKMCKALQWRIVFGQIEVSIPKTSNKLGDWIRLRNLAHSIGLAHDNVQDYNQNDPYLNMQHRYYQLSNIVDSLNTEIERVVKARDDTINQPDRWRESLRTCIDMFEGAYTTLTAPSA
jgi:hypothetical protein